MNTEETILIVAAVAVGLFIFAGKKGTGKQLVQTNPLSNNPNKGINSGKQNTSKGSDALEYINAGVGLVNTVGKAVTGNQSFDAMDQFGKLVGGTGSYDDYAGLA